MTCLGTHGYAKGSRCFGTHDWGAKGRTNAVGALLGGFLLTVGLFETTINTVTFNQWVLQDLISKLPPVSHPVLWFKIFSPTQIHVSVFLLFMKQALHLFDGVGVDGAQSLQQIGVFEECFCLEQEVLLEVCVRGIIFKFL